MVCAGLNKTTRTAEWNEPVSANSANSLALILTPASVNTCTEIAWHHQYGVIARWRPVISAQLSTFLELRPPEFMCMDTKLYQQGVDSSFVHYAENNLWCPLKMHPIKTQKSMKLIMPFKDSFLMMIHFHTMFFSLFIFSKWCLDVERRNIRHLISNKTHPLKYTREGFKVSYTYHKSSGSF